MIYGYEISTPPDRVFWSSWSIFCTFTPLTAWKKKLSKTWKKHLEISSFYTSVPKIMITGYTVAEILHVTDVIVIFYFGLEFSLLLRPPPSSEQCQKWKKCLEISSLYTSAPKIMIICFTVPEIWCVTDVKSFKIHLVTFSWGLLKFNWLFEVRADLAKVDSKDIKRSL